ncbi:hypothetical protein [Streptomyces sp.]|uniref:hypothetical protein n=1 Tax=Streptomyces sp. TaxID=1931 RepID=UPI002F9226C9
MALRMQWDEVAKTADMSPAHLRRIRKNETSITPLMGAGLEAALQWRAGSVEAILLGGTPTPIRPAGSLPALTAQAEGAVTQPEADDEPDSPIAPYLKGILERVDQRLAEMNERIAEQNREIKELRRERRPDEEDRRRKGA